MKLAAIVLIGFALLLLVNLNGSSVESRLIGHHPPGQGHHPPGQGNHPPGQGYHHHDHGDDEDDGEDDGGNKHGGRHNNHHYDGFSLYVFGDSFVDNGNLPRWDKKWPVLSRQWYFPYGSDGRFSDHLVQSDYIAKFLGLSKAPAAYALGRPHSRLGVNFAVGGSGVFKVPQQKRTLAHQIESFMTEIDGGNIVRKHLEEKSVALVAVSGNDYNRVGVDTSGFSDIHAFVENVTSEIVRNVELLIDDIGVQKVLVNNLYPLGCAPSQSRPLNYTACEPQGNQGAALHNSLLAKKLANRDDVRILDLSTAFSNIINPSSGADSDNDDTGAPADGDDTGSPTYGDDTGSPTDGDDTDTGSPTDSDDTGAPADGDDDTTYHFRYPLRPCCYGYGRNDYCGLSTEDNRRVQTKRFWTCPNPKLYFFFDEMHPTQAGWKAVMDQLEGHVKEFLEIEDQE